MQNSTKKISLNPFKTIWLIGLNSILLLLISLPVNAHHPFEFETDKYTIFQGFVSGLAHPVLGPDHLVFLLSIGLAGVLANRLWIPFLLACGLGGCLIGLAIPSIPGIETFVSLSLIASAFVALGKLPKLSMAPLIALHGYALSGVMVGVEPTPLIAYLIGLLLIEVLIINLGLLLVGLFYKQRIVLISFLMGVGFTFTLGTIWG